MNSYCSTQLHICAQRPFRDARRGIQQCCGIRQRYRRQGPQLNAALHCVLLVVTMELVPNDHPLAFLQTQ